MFLRQHTKDAKSRPHLRDAGRAPTRELAHEKGGVPQAPRRWGVVATPRPAHTWPPDVSPLRAARAALPLCSSPAASRHFALLDVALLNA
jgi:hypothetical protein